MGLLYISLVNMLLFWIFTHLVVLTLLNSGIAKKERTSLIWLSHSIFLRGNCTPNQNWAYFGHLLKITNFLWKDYTSNNILQQTCEKLKNGIKIGAGEMVLEFLIVTIFCLIWSISFKKYLAFKNSNSIFEFLRQFALW